MLAIDGITIFVYKQKHKSIEYMPEQSEIEEPKSHEIEVKTKDGVIITEYCKMKPDPLDNLPNKYFLNIHDNISSKRNRIYCVVGSAVIKSRNYRIFVPVRFYPYSSCYTNKVKDKINSIFNDTMRNEEFLKLGCGKFNSIIIKINSLDS